MIELKQKEKTKSGYLAAVWSLSSDSWSEVGTV